MQIESNSFPDSPTLDYFKFSIFILSARILGLTILQIVKYNFAKESTTNSDDDKKFIEQSENHFHENKGKRFFKRTSRLNLQIKIDFDAFLRKKMIFKMV